MAMRTPPRASVEREMVRVTPTPAPRYRPSYIPLPTPLSTPSTATPSTSAVNVRAGLQHRPSESGGSRTSGDDARTGRSSSLSARTSSPALASTGIPAPSRPSFNLSESAATNGHHQRSYSSGLGMDQSRLSSLEAISDSGRNSALGGSCAIDEVDDSERVLPVKVAVRIRPLVVGSGGEQQAGAGRGALTSCLEAVAGGTIAVSGSSSSVVGALADSGAAAQRAFHFDYAFGPDASQAAVYEAAVHPLLQRFVEGYNVTVLAYGQTSSGKTYTMGTESDDGSGVVPRALQWLFAWWAAQDAGRRGSVRISFLEVYNDELIDLVAQAQGRGVRPPIFVREDAKGHVVWTGVKEVAVGDADAALAILADGSRERQTGGTRMNEKSSRSHAIYSVTLAQARGDARIVSKLHFVDLAGSERLKKTLAVGERQREGIAINSGLLALGNVISALGDPHRGAPSFVPYRDSKLTHMLRDSLGGSAQTLLVACVSQAESNVAESLNTLKYAARARNIRNRGGVNMVATRATSREADALRAVVRRLKAEVSELSERLASSSAARDSVGSRLALSPPARASLLADGDTPSRIPTMGAALQRRAEEAGALRARNQALEGELEQLNDTYTELLLKFNDACREIEDRQSEGFARDQRLRDREQEIRRLTAHSRRATADPADAARQKRRSLRVDAEPGELPQLPDLARLRLLRSETADRAGGSEAPGAAEFDAILEECDANVRALEGELRAAHDALAALRLQLDMHETRASFAEKLTASQVAQIDALRAQLEKARDAGVAEEERRRAVEAELEDAALAYEAQLEAVAGEWRQELQHARASAAEAALAALTAKLAAKDEEAPLQPLAVRSLSSELPRRTSDRIILCARNSMAHSSADAEVTPSELRLRNVRHRYSTVAPAHSQQPQPDRFASYPELRLASSPREAPSHAPPVYDEDQIQRMLRDAAAEVDDSGVFAESQERRDLLAEMALLKETKKDLQERNSQMKNLMRDLGDRLVGLAEENDQLEVKANERDQLLAEVERLTHALAKFEDSAADASPRRMSIDSFRSADTTNAMDQLQTRLELAEADLAAAMVSVEEHQSHVTELLHDAEVFRRRIQDLDDDLAQTMRQLDGAREDSRRLEQLARAHADADSELKRQRTLVACLQESLAASEETAEESKLASDRYANELMRVQAESRAVVEQADELQRMLQDARAMVASEARDRDVWKSRCQDLREEVDELRVRRRQNKILCF
ncbi:hypothetical protein GGI10_004410 [Coemansia sp. RSA 2530]|nr:hypothetical protein GGI10_004410 [Coemansia sp. RSA 2530]